MQFKIRDVPDNKTVELSFRYDTDDDNCILLCANDIPIMAFLSGKEYRSVIKVLLDDNQNKELSRLGFMLDRRLPQGRFDISGSYLRIIED